MRTVREGLSAGNGQVPDMGPEHVCPLCARLVRPAGDHIPRHLDQTLGVPCRGSGVPLSHDWERDMI